MNKKIILFSLLVLLAGCNSTNPTTTTPPLKDPTEIDVYFIAGQSNAAGASDFYREDKTTLNLSKPFADKVDLYKNGFNNVFYYGNAYDTYEANAYIVDELINVKACMGVNNEYEIGAELGMAEYLNDKYEGTNKHAVIIKYAVCGSGLICDSVAYGEWSAPSFPNSHLKNQVNLYEKMVGKKSEEYTDGIIYSALSEIASKGYEEVNFKGFFWAQGEAETGAHTDYYDDALIAFVNDLRKDIDKVAVKAAEEHSLIVGETKDLPFVIAEVAPTQDGSKKKADGTASNQYVQNIIDQERAACQQLKNCVPLCTADFDIVNQNAKWKSSENDGISYCADQWHYNGDDMITIGNQVGDLLYNFKIE